MLETINELRQEIQTGRDILNNKEPKTINELLLNIQETMEKFISDITLLCNDKDIMKEDIKNILEDDTIHKDSVIEDCKFITWIVEEQEETLNNIEKTTNKLESRENWKEYKSLC